MKITNIILAAILTIQTGYLFAGNEITSTDVSNPASITIALAPVTPPVATFEEVVTSNLNTLAPVTPPEATFEEVVTIDTNSLAPATPAVADFE